MFLLFIMYALFGSSFPISKFLLGYSSPIFLTSLRMLIAGSLLLFYEFIYLKRKFHFHRSHIWIYLQVIFFGVCLTYTLRYIGLSHLPAAKAAFIFNTAPFFTAFYTYFMNKEKLNRMQWIGLLIGFIGLVPMLMSSSSAEQFFGEIAFISWPELAVLLAVASHAYSWMLMRYLIRVEKYSPTMINSISFSVGGILCLAISLMFETQKTIADPGVFVSWLFIVIIISNIICHNLYGYLLKKYSPTFLSFTGFLGPLFAAFYGWLFLHEKITWHFGLATILVGIGLYLFYRHEKKTATIEVVS